MKNIHLKESIKLINYEPVHCCLGSICDYRLKIMLSFSLLLYMIGTLIVLRFVVLFVTKSRPEAGVDSSLEFGSFDFALALRRNVVFR